MTSILTKIAFTVLSPFIAIGMSIVPGHVAVVQVITQSNDSVSHLEQTISDLQNQLTEVKNRKFGATEAVPVSVALFETSLASQISSSATSMTLVSGTDKAGIALASSTYGMIIDEGTASEEMVLADCTSTACTNMTRGISPTTGTSTVAALQKTHRRGASVKITDGPQLMILTRIIKGIGTFPNKISYTSEPTFSVGTEIIDKTYADNLSFAGAPDSSATTKGILEKATGAEAASGAADGSGNTTAPLALTSSIATSTCQVTGNNVLVSSTTTGKLDAGCIATNGSLNYTGVNTFSGPTTLSGLSNIIASSTQYILNVGQVNATSTPKVNGIPLRLQQYSYSTSTAITSTGNTSSFATTSTSFVIPAGVMTASSTIDIYGHFTSAASGGTTQSQIWLAEGLTGRPFIPFASATNINPATGNTVEMSFHAHILSNSSLQSQSAYLEGCTIQTAGTISSGSQLCISEHSNSTVDLTQAFSPVVVIEANSTNASLVKLQDVTIVVNP